MPVLDPLVFDVGMFDAAYAVPFMQKAVMQRGYRRTVSGNTVPVLLYIQQGDTTPGRLYSLNPETSTQIQVYNPDGTIKTAYTSMVNKSLGIYEAVILTASGDPKGQYQGDFKMINGDKTTVTEKVRLFELV
jgi:hypothetical protein